MGRVHTLDCVPKGVERVELAHAEHGHGKHALFPCGVKDRLVLFRFDRAVAGHTTHVMHAIHRSSPWGEGLGIRGWGKI